MIRHGQLIVFEGPDGVGKSTLAGKIASRLRDQGTAVEEASLPGSRPGTLGAHVHRLHHDPRKYGIEHIDPTSVQVLHAAAQIDTLNRVIRPALDAGRWVVLDRFWWSTIAYGQVLGACRESLTLLEQLALLQWSSLSPMIVFVVKRTLAVPLHKELTAVYEGLAGRDAHPHAVETLVNDSDIESAVDTALGSVARYASQKPVSLTTNPRRIDLWKQLDPAKATPVYDSLWRFAAERQNVLFRRLRGNAPPWTNDEILQQHRFTNAYRAADRVSQYLIRKVAFNDEWDTDDLMLRIILFKLFNRIETWELLQRHFGPISCRSFEAAAFGEILSEARRRGQRIYSAAYIMASAKTAFGFRAKHENHLALLELMIKDSLPHRIAESRGLQEVYELLLRYPSIGSFLAFQYAIDLNYSNLTDFSEMSFVVPGPGARDGIAKCFVDRGGLNEADLIKWVTDRQEVEFERLEIDFQTLGGRRLQLVDCQNLFCEVDKYARVRHPEHVGLSGRTRIKQKFKPRQSPIRLWFPPKWGINQEFDSLQPRTSEKDDANLFSFFSQ